MLAARWSTPRCRHAVSALRVGKAWLFYYLAWRRADGPSHMARLVPWRRIFLAMQIETGHAKF